MSYRIYTTDSIVLSHVDIGEANRLYSIYTRDLGRVIATAQGIRHMKSKLRFGLQRYAHVSTSFVRGRDIWRITTATPLSPLFESTSEMRYEERRLVASMTGFVERLIAGEEADEDVFLLLKSALESLPQQVERDQYRAHDALFKMRLLIHLGHARSLDPFKELVSGRGWSEDERLRVLEHKQSIKKELSHALSHLQL